MALRTFTDTAVNALRALLPGSVFPPALAPAALIRDLEALSVQCYWGTWDFADHTGIDQNSDLYNAAYQKHAVVTMAAPEGVVPAANKVTLPANSIILGAHIYYESDFETSDDGAVTAVLKKGTTAFTTAATMQLETSDGDVDAMTLVATAAYIAAASTLRVTLAVNAAETITVGRCHFCVQVAHVNLGMLV